jgi:hypothetical protein
MKLFPTQKTCINCHFIHRQFRDETGREHKMEIPLKNRSLSRNKDFSWQRDSESLGCYKGVWDEGHNFPQNLKYELIVKTKRGNKCYFWPFQAGTFLNTADDLYNKNQEAKSTTKNYRIAIYGLILTIIGSLIALL